MGAADSTTALERAFAKINLCLFLGPTRPDGRHELVTVFESLDLADELTIAVIRGRAGAPTPDQLVCEGVAGPNLVAAALAALREAGWAPPPLRVEIIKRIPVAAGLGGGSADAAAILRRAPAIAPVDPRDVERIAVGLGADVPSQISPGQSIGTGAGELVEPVPPLPEHCVLVVPQPFKLPTPEVFREADRLGLPRTGAELATRVASIRRALTGGAPLDGELVVNDLQAAALSLRPEIADAIERGLDAGADQMLVCGSGPTSIGIFWGARCRQRARAAARSLRARYPGATAAQPVTASVVNAQQPAILDP